MELYPPTVRHHPSDDALEAYALDRMPASEMESLEIHLLVCTRCQEALEETEEFVAAMREGLRSFAAAAPAPQRSGWREWLQPRPLWAFTGALAALAVAVAVSQPGTPTAVVLRAERSGSPGAWAVAPAHTALSLSLRSDPATLAHGARVQIVDATGHTAWNGTYEHRAVELRTPLPAGLYWVRLYDGEQRLLQEYGLRLQ